MCLVFRRALARLNKVDSVFLALGSALTPNSKPANLIHPHERHPRSLVPQTLDPDLLAYSPP